ncbi:hypothetical protein [Lentilactobacillus parakefiri]|nr:hypothetical protein [Lentilactobacillus parakefiri]KRL70530.1 hypothetical protein FD08_GL001006 [Lentilactobacillus parakefiri DSM 10551]
MLDATQYYNIPEVTNMTKSTNNKKLIQVEVDKALYEDSKRVLDDIGIPMPVLINALLKRIVAQGRVPFDLAQPEGQQSNSVPKGKSRHKFTKELAKIPFYVDHDGAKATVYWQKRNEMLIKAGAVMKADPKLNKDGSLGFSAKFAQKLRSEHTDSFQNFVTTKDIILKSVNEVGLFLYFAGTNSWLVLKDKNGKSINAWSVVVE